MELSEIEKEVLKQLRTNEKIKYVCVTNGKRLEYNGYFFRDDKVIVEFAELED